MRLGTTSAWVTARHPRSSHSCTFASACASLEWFLSSHYVVIRLFVCDYYLRVTIRSYQGNRAGQDFNTPQWSGFSRMAAGGSVYWRDQQSRFNDNGHFDVACKHWFGWIEDNHVVRMQSAGASVACPTCVASFTGKLNSFDRPDVVPGSTPTPYFAVRIEYESTGADTQHLLYIYYRSSYARSRKGVSVQYCKRQLASHLNAGAISTCWDFDVAGDTYSMEDRQGQVNANLGDVGGWACLLISLKNAN